MPHIDLRYGCGTIPLEYDGSQMEVLGHAAGHVPLSDIEIGERLDDPIGTRRLEEIVGSEDTVLIVVPDATREAGTGQIVNLVVRRLIAAGVSAFNIRIIFATGIHRRVTETEKEFILTPFIKQRIRSLDHDARDLMQIVRVGETSSGIPVELNRALIDHRHVILIGGISFHYFAGFTGGRKLVCPGLASARTIAATHKLAFDCETHRRRDGVGTAMLDGNAVHEAFMEAASKVQVAFCISATVDDEGSVTGLHCGDLVGSHKAACEAYLAENTALIDEKRGLVIVSCGGSPHDVNMIQAHKALDAAAAACTDGGTIILLAECAEGTGRSDFINWFDAADSAELGRRLCESYQVNGQTAWSLLEKAERFDIRIVTSLPAEATEKMRLTSMQSLARAVSKAGKEKAGYILPNGARTLVRVA